MRLFAVLLVPCLLAAPPLRLRIDRILNSSPALQRAHWGIEVRSLRTGAVVYETNAQKLFVPASNTKLFSTALALQRLGPEHRFTTTIRAATAADAQGVLTGDLTFVGGGDPALSARTYPYQKEPSDNPQPLRAVEELADAIVQRGVRVIAGDIVGDDTAYLYDPYPDGWAQDDGVWEYGAPVSALTLNDNAFAVHFQAGSQPGEPVALTMQAALPYPLVVNRVTTSSATGRRIRAERLTGSEETQVTGEIPAGYESFTQWFAVPDPALYAAHALYDALTRRGVQVRGRPVARHQFAHDPWPAPPALPSIELARRSSPPLWQILQVVNKASQNLHAELVLCEVSRQKHGTGSREKALGELEEFLREVGVTPEEFRFEDGSGLSRLTLASPAATVKLLQYMDKSPHAEVWKSLLPVGGQDGTLEKRLTPPSGRRVQAKTGSLSHVSTLSGYIASPRLGPLVFSIMVNNYAASSAEVRKGIDAVALLLSQ